MRREALISWILRVGLAFAFLYPPLSAFIEPQNWIGYFPSFMHGVVDDTLLLHAFGVLEVAIALSILSGWKIFYSSLLAAVLLVSIVVLNAPEFPVLFRDLSIAALALSLTLLHAPKRATV